MNIQEKLKALRTVMTAEGLDAYIITGSDPHGSEYPPPLWRTRAWISGFTGSAGIVAVTRDSAGLWTDFRYWIQAPGELEGSGITLHRDGADGVLRIHEWLAENLPRGGTVGVDGRTLTGRTASEWESTFSNASIVLKTGIDLIDGIWDDRPDLPNAAVVELDDDETGESRPVRIERLNLALKKAGADTWIGIALDSAAWLLNIRGSDVPYNPVAAGFLIHTPEKTTWFTDEGRLPRSLVESLSDDGIDIAPYQGFYPGIGALPDRSMILVDPDTVSRGVLDRIPSGARVKTGKDPVIQMKARKNPTEIRRTFRAMEKDGVAFVRFLMDLEKGMDEGRSISELDAAAMLRARRGEIPGFIGDSFSTIPAFGPHGAICHYEATAGSSLVLEGGSHLFLIDSGGQWEEGTTDITRTVTLGTPSEIQMKDYTLVLKGHIALSRAKFPKGTRGYQLDTLARAAMWDEGINYGHGTGHGVGYRLNVHEGPQKISPAPVDVALEPGMVVSNEPGIYREGEWGIRIENLLLCREDFTNRFGTFLSFDTLTLAPYSRDLIAVELLRDDEIIWVDAYHTEVLRRLSPLLETQETRWLKKQTSPLTRGL